MTNREFRHNLREVERDIASLWRIVANFPVRWVRGRHGPGGGSWIGYVTGSTLQTGHDARWDYTVKRAAFDSSGWTIITGGSAQTVTATNRRELAHIAEPGAGVDWYVWGVDAHGDDYPASFAPLPVGGGGTTGTHKTDILVTVFEMIDEAGVITYEFDAIGSHDGTC